MKTSLATVWELFEVFSIEDRWVLTRGPFGCALVNAEDLVIDDAKVQSWMAVHENERDLDSGGHVLRETTSRGLCGLVCPSRTSSSERGRLQPLYLFCSTKTSW
jgi:hypothetical protein